ncbi:uncharacterized protein LOC106646558, partial [Copidosoma floridanum]|uniref:uncharacterized protein LOC106646558 n=1 Tax=Copidosoma floridanum TaxID=29053 RepID=UPI0006C9E334
KPANVYFLKHENRTWTTEELCNIEAAARLHPEYNVFLINLEKRGDRGGTLVSRVSKGRRKISVRNEGSSESRTRRELSRMSNVENVNVGLEKFFHGSVVSKKIGQLTVDKLELAAKFHAIWEAPGIALEPLNAHQLSSVARLFNSSQGDPLAGVQMDGDLQAASVACHSFVGLVNREISKSGVPERRTVLKRALLNFCSR